MQRSSNLELYRIVCMLMIVAHHFVVNSGLMQGPIAESPYSLNSLFLLVFGMWGKIGINCFLLITGYFMCKSSISVRKFLKLSLEIYFYRITIFFVFLLFGYEELSLSRFVRLLSPVWGFHTNFTSCFLAFWLTIPFLNVLVQHLNRVLHARLVFLSLGYYSVLSIIPGFYISFNYITWFTVLYFTASFIRLYPIAIFQRRNLWGWAALVLLLLSVLSVLVFHRFGQNDYYFVSDSNKLLAVCVAVTSFLWFKNLDISYNKVVNLIGGSTFGVLLIHANSDAMRKWLWGDLIDCVGHYSMPFGNLLLFCFSVVIAIFFICVGIDRIRIYLIETPFFKWYDSRINK